MTLEDRGSDSLAPTSSAQLAALLWPSRLAAFGPGEYVGQEGFMTASAIVDLARRAGIGPGTRVLDLCCGTAGPGGLVARELGCSYLGVDSNAESIAIGRDRAGGGCRFVVSTVPPLPAGDFEVVLLLETLLAFPDKPALLEAVAASLAPRGRFACTVEEGLPLTASERAVMPAADTVWPVPLARLWSDLERVGLRVAWQDECTQAHRAVVDALLGRFSAHAEEVRRQPGGRGIDQLVAGHRLWSDWLGRGRVRKFSLVAEKVGSAG